MGVSATCFRDLETFFKKLKISIFDPISNYFFVFFFVILASFFASSRLNEVFGVKSFLLAYITASQ